MKYINVEPLEDWCEKGVGFEIKPINNHTVSVKVTCGERQITRDFDFDTFGDRDDKRISQIIGSVINSMTDKVLGIEL